MEGGHVEYELAHAHPNQAPVVLVNLSSSCKPGQLAERKGDIARN